MHDTVVQVFESIVHNMHVTLADFWVRSQLPSRPCLVFPHVTTLGTAAAVATLSVENVTLWELLGLPLALLSGWPSIYSPLRLSFVLAILVVWFVAGGSFAFATHAARDHVDISRRREQRWCSGGLEEKETGGREQDVFVEV